MTLVIHRINQLNCHISGVKTRKRRLVRLFVVFAIVLKVTRRKAKEDMRRIRAAYSACACCNLLYYLSQHK